MWKFHDFSVTQILREINFAESRRSKTDVLAILEDFQNDHFDKFQPSENAKIHKKSQFRTSKCVEMTYFALLESQKLISHKI